MKYRIADRSAHRMRMRLCISRMTEEQAEILKYVFSQIEGVEKVSIYRATCGCAFTYHCAPEEITRRLDHFRFENVTMLAEEEGKHISAQEMRERKLHPEIKRRLRLRALAETVADLALPAPVQVGYHIYQMITLKDV